MEDLRHDPEYEIRWPREILAAELDRVIARGRVDGCDAAWQDEVATLLRQAFPSQVPQRDFQERLNQSPRTMSYDEEPF